MKNPKLILSLVLWSAILTTLPLVGCGTKNPVVSSEPNFVVPEPTASATPAGPSLVFEPANLFSFGEVSLLDSDRSQGFKLWNRGGTTTESCSVVSLDGADVNEFRLSGTSGCLMKKIPPGGFCEGIVVSTRAQSLGFKSATLSVTCGVLRTEVSIDYTATDRDPTPTPTPTMTPTPTPTPTPVVTPTPTMTTTPTPRPSITPTPTPVVTPTPRPSITPTPTPVVTPTPTPVWGDCMTTDGKIKLSFYPLVTPFGLRTFVQEVGGRGVYSLYTKPFCAPKPELFAAAVSYVDPRWVHAKFPVDQATSGPLSGEAHICMGRLCPGWTKISCDPNVRAMFNSVCSRQPRDLEMLMTAPEVRAFQYQ